MSMKKRESPCLQPPAEDVEEELAFGGKKDPGPAKRNLFSFMKKEDDKSNVQRFEDGVSFRGKLIGVERVDNIRSSDVCQKAIQKLKAAVKILGEHKQRIEFSVSYKGVRIRDERSGELLHMHQLNTISFICQDSTDPRAFGYIFRNDENVNHCIAIKTEKTALQAVKAFGELFEASLALMKEKNDEKDKSENNPEKYQDGEEQKEALPSEENLLIIMDEPNESDQLQEELERLTTFPNNIDGTVEEENAIFDPFDTSFISPEITAEKSAFPEPLIFQEISPSDGNTFGEMPRENMGQVNFLESCTDGFFNVPAMNTPTQTTPNPFAITAPQKPPRIPLKSNDPFADLDPLNKGDFKSLDFSAKKDTLNEPLYGKINKANTADHPANGSTE